jgi:hypothetical protein
VARSWNPAYHPRDKRGRFTRSATRVMTAADKKRGRKALENMRPRVFTDGGEARTYLDGLGSPDAAGGVRKYLDGDWRQVNAALRAGKPVDTAELDQAMKPLPDDLLLRRQVPLSLFAHVPMKDLEGMKVRDAAYASTSLDLGPSGGAPDTVTMHIVAPAGTKAHVNAADGEILLDRDTEVAISRVEPDGNGGWDVYGVVLPKAAPRKKPTSPAVADRPDPVASRGPARGDAALAASPKGLGREAPGLTGDQENALRDYESAYSQAINGQLRRGEVSDTVRKSVEAIDTVMAGSALTADVQVWRGKQNGARMFGDRMQGDLTGMRWREDAYVSTSADERQARAFTADGDRVNPVLMRIDAPAGTGAVEISPMGEQAELLLDRGHEFEVTSDRGPVGGVRRLDVAVRAKPDPEPGKGSSTVEPAKAWTSARSGEQAFMATTTITQAAGGLVLSKKIRHREMQRVQQAAVAYGQDPRAGDLNYVTINAALRGHGGQIASDAPAEIRQTVEDLDLMVGSTGLRVDTIAYRGIQSPSAAIPGWRDGADNVGLEWTAEGYQSTTTDLKVAQGFASGSMAGGTRSATPMVARVLIPKGVPGMQMSPVVSEILLARNQRFRLVADRGIVDGMHQVDVEVLAGGSDG